MRWMEGIPLARRSALAMLALSVVALAYAGIAASRLEPLPDEPAPRELPAMPTPPAMRPALGGAALAAADRNPFRPDRTRHAGRYQQPGQPVTPTYAPSAPGNYASLVQLQGIVTLPGGGGLAALWVPGKQPQVVKVGGTYEGYRLSQVTAGKAILVGPDGTLTLQMKEAAFTLTQNPSPR